MTREPKWLFDTPESTPNRVMSAAEVHLRDQIDMFVEMHTLAQLKEWFRMRGQSMQSCRTKRALASLLAASPDAPTVPQMKYLCDIAKKVGLKLKLEHYKDKRTTSVTISEILETLKKNK